MRDSFRFGVPTFFARGRGGLDTYWKPLFLFCAFLGVLGWEGGVLLKVLGLVPVVVDIHMSDWESARCALEVT